MIFDVGAKVGDFRKILVNNFPQSTIHAFEPHPLIFVELERILPFSQIAKHNVDL